MMIWFHMGTFFVCLSLDFQDTSQFSGRYLLSQHLKSYPNISINTMLFPYYIDQALQHFLSQHLPARQNLNILGLYLYYPLLGGWVVILFPHVLFGLILVSFYASPSRNKNRTNNTLIIYSMITGKKWFSQYVMKIVNFYRSIRFCCFSEYLQEHYNRVYNESTFKNVWNDIPVGQPSSIDPISHFDHSDF